MLHLCIASVSAAARTHHVTGKSCACRLLTLASYNVRHSGTAAVSAAKQGLLVRHIHGTSTGHTVQPAQQPTSPSTSAVHSAAINNTPSSTSQPSAQNDTIANNSAMPSTISSSMPPSLAQNGAIGHSTRQQNVSYVQRLADGVKKGDRLSVSRAITLCESSHPAHAEQATELLLSLERLNQLYGAPSSFRVGVTGPPGAGKSCLMEALGIRLVNAGSRVAVLAIDPSSEATGGAILGDKLRMPQLTTSDHAYVRPSPTRGTLGGVARATADAIFICESAGYDQVLVETVGLGQSETMFSELVDCAVLVLPPIGGDEWQAMKKGIMEVVDILAVNKADGAAMQAALNTVSSYTGAMSFLSRRHRHWAPKVLAVSAKSGYQLERLQNLLQEYRQELTHTGELQRQRSRQRAKLFWLSAEEQLLARFRHSEQVPGIASSILPSVVMGNTTVRAGADRLVQQYLQHTGL